MKPSDGAERSIPRLPLSPARSPYTHEVALENWRVAEAARRSLLDQTQEDLEDIDGLNESDEDEEESTPSETDTTLSDDEDKIDSDSSDEEWVTMAAYVREFFAYCGISERNWEDDPLTDAPFLRSRVVAEDALEDLGGLSVGGPVQGESYIQEGAANANDDGDGRASPVPPPSADTHDAEQSTSEPIPSSPESTDEGEPSEELVIQPMRPARGSLTADSSGATENDPERQHHPKGHKQPSLWKRVLGQLFFEKIRVWKKDYDFWATIVGSAVDPARAFDAVSGLMDRLHRKADLDARGAPPRKSRRRRQRQSEPSTFDSQEESTLRGTAQIHPLEAQTGSRGPDRQEQVGRGAPLPGSLETVAEFNASVGPQEVSFTVMAPSGTLERLADLSESANRRSLKRRSSDQQLSSGRRRVSSNVRQPLALRGESRLPLLAERLSQEDLVSAFRISFRLPATRPYRHDSSCDHSMTGHGHFMSREGAEASGQTIAQRETSNPVNRTIIPQQTSRTPIARTPMGMSLQQTAANQGVPQEPMLATGPLGLGSRLCDAASSYPPPGQPSIPPQEPRVEAGPSRPGFRLRDAASSDLPPGQPSIPPYPRGDPGPSTLSRTQPVEPLRSPISLRPPLPNVASSSRASAHAARTMAVRMQNVTGPGVLYDRTYNAFMSGLSAQPGFAGGALTASQSSGLSPAAAPFIPSRPSRPQRPDAESNTPSAVNPSRPSAAFDPFLVRPPLQPGEPSARPPMIRSWQPGLFTAPSMPFQQAQPFSAPTPATGTYFPQNPGAHGTFPSSHWSYMATGSSNLSTATQRPPSVTPVQSVPNDQPQPDGMTAAWLTHRRPRFSASWNPTMPTIRAMPTSEYWSFGQAQSIMDQSVSQHVPRLPPPERHSAVNFGPIGATRPPMQPFGSQPGPSSAGPSAVAFGPSQPVIHAPPNPPHWPLNPHRDQGSSASGSMGPTGTAPPSAHPGPLLFNQGDVVMDSPDPTSQFPSGSQFPPTGQSQAPS